MPWCGRGQDCSMKAVAHIADAVTTTYHPTVAVASQFIASMPAVVEAVSAVQAAIGPGVWHTAYFISWHQFMPLC